MTAIKINYRTLDGKPTSTTIANSVCKFYAESTGVKIGIMSDADYVAKIRKLAQDFVNSLAEQTKQCELELNKDFIENMLLTKAKNNFIKQRLTDKQLDLL